MDLASLAKRVERLEKRGTIGEALVPNYLTITPTGLVIAQFSGLIVGSIVLPEASSAAPDSTRTVRWTNDGTPNGTTEEFLQGVNLGGGLHELFVATTPDAQDSASLVLTSSAGGAAGGSQAEVILRDSAGGAVQAIISDSASKSTFAQLPPGQVLRTQALWGSFGSGATIPSGTSSGGYTVARTAAGNYAISFTTHFADAGYAFIAMTQGVGTTNHKANWTGLSAAGISVELSAADVLADMSWMFIAIGAC